MRFWDSSALVPLFAEEERSPACRALARHGGTTIVWAFTRTEVVSALQRLVRDHRLDRKDLAGALRRLDKRARGWTEVLAFEAVRERAERALAVHALTAADALQLGAALVAVKDRPRRRSFVTSDDRLAAAAEAEGFDVTVPQP